MALAGLEEEAAALPVALATGALAVTGVSWASWQDLRAAGVVPVDAEAGAALAARLTLGEDDIVADTLGTDKVTVVADRASGSVGVGRGSGDEGSRGEDGGEELELHCGRLVWLRRRRVLEERLWSC